MQRRGPSAPSEDEPVSRPESGTCGSGAVVIVGAGPAGTLAALYLARRGFNVQVFDARPDPNTTSHSDNKRAVCIRISNVAIEACRRAGVEAPNHPGLWLAAGAFRRLGSGKERRIFSSGVKHGQWYGERAFHVCHLLNEAQRLHPHTITFHWNTPLLDVDFEQQVAAFPDKQLRYDLLVGADGRGSKVRTLLAQRDPSLKVTHHPSNRSYKAFHGLPSQDACPLFQDKGALIRVFEPARLPWMKLEQQVAFFVTPAVDGTVTGGLIMASSDFEKLKSEADYRRFMDEGFAALPIAWRDAVVQMQSAAPLSLWGSNVNCSKVHGPRCVLLGDAAHATTPTVGIGMNSALVDSIFLDQSLEAVNNDLALLPPRFSEATAHFRQSLTALDLFGLDSVQQRASPYDPLQGLLNRQSVKVMWHVISRGLASWMLPGVVEPPAFAQLNVSRDETVFVKAHRQLEGDSKVGLAIGAALLVAIAVRVAAVLYAV